MSQNDKMIKSYKGIDIYNNGKEYISKEEERTN